MIASSTPGTENNRRSRAEKLQPPDISPVFPGHLQVDISRIRCYRLHQQLHTSDPRRPKEYGTGSQQRSDSWCKIGRKSRPGTASRAALRRKSSMFHTRRQVGGMASSHAAQELETSGLFRSHHRRSTRRGFSSEMIKRQTGWYHGSNTTLSSRFPYWKGTRVFLWSFD